MTIKLRRLFIKDVRPFVSFLENISIDLVLWGAMIGWGIVLTGLSIARYEGYNADMFDLGNMAQAIASVQRGESLVFTYSSGQMSRLALHVEFIYFILALPYALWPDPRLLLIIQAALYTLGAIPVYSLAQRRLNSVFAARCIALIYLFYPAAQTGVLLDIHGDTLAMPLLLFALEASDRRAWRTFVIFIALALSCKFYVALSVILIGVMLWWQHGERQAGIKTMVTGIAYGIFAFFIIRPLFTQTSELHQGINYVSFYFGEFNEVLATWDWRLANAIVVFGPALFVAWRGWRWLLAGLPIALAALLSTKGGSAGYDSHHYGLVVPFVVLATIDGVERMRKAVVGNHATIVQRANPKPRKGRSWRGDLGITLLIVIIFNLAFIDTPLSPTFWMSPPNHGLDHARFGVTSRDHMKDRFLAQEVPPDAPIAASLYLAPHLANRETLYMVRYEVGQVGRLLPATLPYVDYVLADALFDFRLIQPDGSFDGGAHSELREIGQVLRDPAFGLIAARDGLLLFERDAPEKYVLKQWVEVDEAGAVRGHAQFGDKIILVDARIEPLGERRFQTMFAWQISGDQPLEGSFVAISQLEGVPNARMVHLPTYALLPTTEWQPGQVVRETFDVKLPDNLPPGNYTWKTSWYNLGHSEAHATDKRSRLPDSDEVSIDTITIPQP